VGGFGGAGIGGILGSLGLGGLGGGAPGAPPGTPSGGFSLPSLVGAIKTAASGGGTAALGTALAPLTLMGSVLGLQGAFGLGRLAQRGAINPVAGAIGAAGLGAFSGALGAGSLMAMMPFLAAGGPLGILIGAGIGAAIGLTGFFKQSDQQHVRQLIKQFYGIDISNISILNEIVNIGKQQFGGNYSLAVASPQVQQIVNLYAASQGTLAGHMPRPMYPATFAQSSAAIGGAAAGLQLQPTYMNGQLVNSPYTGATSYQWGLASQLFYGGTQAQNFRNALYLQLDPQMAQALFSGNVISVLNSNPTVVGNVNSNAIASGASRNSQLGGLLEPSTVVY
jgi:hypothetical protein